MEQMDHLIIQYLTGEISPEEQRSLLSRLETGEEHRDYFRSLKDAYDLGRLEFDMIGSRMKRKITRRKHVLLKKFTKCTKKEWLSHDNHNLHC
jgi:hypothetical protein